MEQGGTLKSENDKDTVITNNNKNTASSHTVTIEAKDKDDKVEVKLDNVNIDTSKQNKAAVSVTGSGNTTIELDGSNTLKSGSGHAGLEHNKTDTSGELTIQDNDKNGSLKATGGEYGAGIGGGKGVYLASDKKIHGGDGKVTITGGKITATSKSFGAGIGGGSNGSGDVTIEGNTEVNAAGGTGGAGIGGGYGAKNNSNSTGNQITIRSNENGAPTVNATGGESSIDKKTGEKIPSGAGIGSGAGDAKANITLEGKVTIVAKAGDGNVAIGDINGEQELNGLAPGSNVTRSDSEGNDISLPGDKVPTPSGGGSAGGDSAGGDSTGGDSADVSVQESVFPGLVVTGKDGQRTSYTSIRGNNVLSLRVGRFTASFRISLSTLRQLRAEGIDTITFQTILCSTTLSVDELLAMGGEDTEVVLTHHIRSSTLTVGGKAV